MSTTKREHERKQENGENQEISNIENGYEKIIENYTQKHNTYTQIPKTETKDETKKQTKKHDNKHPYQSKLKNIYGSTLAYMM